jgi:hypothetical protein
MIYSVFKCVVNWLHLLWSGHQSSEQSPNVLFLLELFVVVGSLGVWKMFQMCCAWISLTLHLELEHFSFMAFGAVLLCRLGPCL